MAIDVPDDLGMDRLDVLTEALGRVPRQYARVGARDGRARIAPAGHLDGKERI